MTSPSERGDRIACSIALCGLAVSIAAACVYLTIMPSAAWLIAPWFEGSPTLYEWLLNHTTERWFNFLVGALAFIGYMGFVACCGVGLIAGLRARRVGSPGWAPRILLGLGISLGLCLCGRPWINYHLLRHRMEESQTQSAQLREKMRSRLESGEWPVEKLDLLWGMYARTMYTDTGTRIEIPDDHGGMTLYQPTEADERGREVTLFMYRSLTPSYGQTARMAFFALACAALGLLTPVRPREFSPPVLNR